MRLVDADVLKELLTDEYKKLNDVFNETSVFKAPNDVALYGALMQEVGAVIGAIDEAPTVDAVPVVHGRWIAHTMSEITGYDPVLSGDDPVCSYSCSVCGEDCYVSDTGDDILSNYCPNCGARLDGNG